MDSAMRAIFYNERGLRAGWRFLIFAGMIWLVYIAAQVVTRRAGPGGGIPADAGYSLPILLAVGELIPFLVVLFFSWIMSRIEHRTVGDYGLPLRKHAWSRFWTGYLFWGFVPLSILLLAMRAFHVFSFGELAIRGQQILIWGVLWLFVFLMVGFLEEFLFRGYALHTLADGIGFWPAAILMAILFARGHMGNGGETRLGIVATAFFALFAAATLRRTGDLWLAVGAHCGWDWAQSFFYGVPDSGLKTPGHLLSPHLSTTAPVWLSGGSVGPEGSVLTLILWGAMFAVFLLVYRKRQEPALIMTTAAEAPAQQA